MGRRRNKWKTTQPSINQPTFEKPTDMIEHSINKHEVPKSQPYQPTNYYNRAGKKHKTKEEMDTYITDLASKGYVVGAKVLTSYNAKGVITRIVEIGKEGLDYYGSKNAPDIFFITREGAYSETSVTYNESELTLEEQQTC